MNQVTLRLAAKSVDSAERAGKEPSSMGKYNIARGEDIALIRAHLPAITIAADRERAENTLRLLEEGHREYNESPEWQAQRRAREAEQMEALLKPA